MDFVHLHVHTEYSLLDGCCRIEKLVDAAAEAGQKAIAVTDHGVMYGAVEFYKAAKKRGIKPIIGCEVYVAPRTRFDKQKPLDSEYTHLVLLCESNEGYQNLIKIVSLGFTEGFYSKPRIDRELLEKHHGGLIALSACLAGELPRKLLSGDYDGAKESALWFDGVFGHGNYFIELQDHGISEQKRVNPQLIRLSGETGIPMAVTNDVHYIAREDSRTHKILLCVQTGKKINEENPIEFKTDEFYLKSADEMAALFPGHPETVTNTVKIAERCNVEFEFGKIKLPRFDIGNRDHFDYFREKCYQGLYRIYGNAPEQAAVDRLEYELSVIHKMGYVDYYLIVADFVGYAKSQGIPVGPGRGSGAGSIAAYCIGITGIDPLKYNLFFERFLNPERVSMPDFDIDFCYVNRQRVIDYVIAKYGADHVTQIVTFGTMAARGAVRDVGRALDIPYATCDRVAKMIPQSPGMTIDRALETNADLREACSRDSEVKELINTALKVEGMPRHASTHAAGVVIADKPVSEYVPLAVNDEAVVTQYTMTVLDELGLLKMDFLGLRNLTVIADAEKAVRRRIPDFSAEKIPTDDAETFAMMSKGLADGVFQFESEGMKNVLRQLGPERIEDLIAVISLFRPGPMDSIPKYIHNRHHPEDITYCTPLLKPILDVTYGCIVYQEQVMQIFRSLAGYSLGRADIVRRAMSKKKHEVMRRERETFVYGQTDENGSIICEGAVRRGVSEADAQRLFDDMSAFSSYAFNKSHAAAYAVVSYRTAYLKCHYPAEYFAALLTSILDSAGKISVYTAECRRLGIKVLPPHVNESFEYFSASGDEIRFGLLAIKNLGKGIIEHIISSRLNDGKYTSMYDFCKRNAGRDFNRRSLEGLIKSGALDGLEKNRRTMIYSIDSVLSVIEEERRFTGEGQMDIFGEAGEKPQLTLQAVEEMPREQLLALEKEATGLYLSGHPMDAYRVYTENAGMAKSPDILAGKYPDGKRIVIAGLISGLRVRQLKNGNTLATAQLEDIYGCVDITVFANAFGEYRQLLTEGGAVILHAKVSEREDRDAELICEKLERIPENAASAVKKHKSGLYLRVTDTVSAEFTSVRELLALNHGRTPVYIYCTATGKKLEAPAQLRADTGGGLIEKLNSLLGKDNVVLIK